MTPQERQGSLLDLANRCFSRLLPGEASLIRASAAGVPLALTAQSPVRAAVVEWLCADRAANGLVGSRGIDLRGATVEGPLRLTHATAAFPLFLTQCTFDAGIDLSEASLGDVRLTGSQVPSLCADGARFSGGLSLDGGFHSRGQVSLVNAKVGGDLVLDAGRFQDQEAEAIVADKVHVAGDVFLGEGFEADGEVRLLGARIRGDVFCSWGRFLGSGGVALSIEGCEISGDLCMSDKLPATSGVFRGGRFSAYGTVSLIGTTIGGDLDCGPAVLWCPAGDALNAQRVVVRGDARLRDGVSIVGNVSFHGARVTGVFDCTHVSWAPDSDFELRYARIGVLFDDEHSWPEVGHLYLNGLQYEGIDDRSPLDALSRLRWLGRQEPDRFLPQPYEQLASALSQAGYVQDARCVLIRKEVDRARLVPRPPLERLGHGLLGATIGYGYYPWKALRWSLVSLIVGTLLFWAGFRAGVLQPAESDLARTHGPLPASAQAADGSVFSAPVYSLDAFVPLIDLGQADHWVPLPGRSGSLYLGEGVRVTLWGGWIRAYHWIHAFAGWLLSVLLLAGLTGLLRGEPD